MLKLAGAILVGIFFVLVMLSAFLAIAVGVNFVLNVLAQWLKGGGR